MAGRRIICIMLAGIALGPAPAAVAANA
ncbi:MAG: hypothetical protein QOK21_4450, partial [Solirubrobacteraceae bacterium]|nr:hypothetical protein [Solirubrobacteraceae bacterium]